MSISRPDNVPFGMNMGAVAVAFRWPRLPVVVTSPKGLAAAFDRKRLIAFLAAQTPTDSRFEVKVIDTTELEFWYDTTQRILALCFASKVWTKRQLVQLYNDSSGAALSPYAPGSLPNRRLDRIVQEMPTSSWPAQQLERHASNPTRRPQVKRGKGLANKSLQLSSMRPSG